MGSVVKRWLVGGLPSMGSLARRQQVMRLIASRQSLHPYAIMLSVSNDRWITVLGVLVFLAAWSKWLVQKAYGSDGFRGLWVHIGRGLRRK
jgi:hypothetical protein